MAGCFAMKVDPDEIRVGGRLPWHAVTQVSHVMRGGLGCYPAQGSCRRRGLAKLDGQRQTTWHAFITAASLRVMKSTHFVIGTPLAPVLKVIEQLVEFYLIHSRIVRRTSLCHWFTRCFRDGAIGPGTQHPKRTPVGVSNEPGSSHSTVPGPDLTDKS